MRPVIICVWMLVLTAYVMSGSVPFRMKHRSSGKYIDIAYRYVRAPNYTKINLRSSPNHYHSNLWRFEQITDHWGYLQQVTSERYMHVSGGDINAGDGTELLLHSNRHWGALFSMDAVNSYIMHKSGRYIHPPSGTRQPSDGEELWIWGGTHDGMKFRFVDAVDNYPLKDHPVYGAPIMIGKWSLINMVLNAIGTHVTTFTITVGKSVTHSTTTSFQYTWEVSAGVEIKAFSASVSQSFQYMVQQTSSATFTEAITKTTQITVTPGNSVVTWQWVIDVEQNSSKGVYQSNLLADTDSTTKKPDDLQFYEV